ncbi:hypothetical protein, partial [Sutterella wadsworthensis]|uniref:hypothetical protein n=1 Tax=Sutterella wadsworthensis TaxID=40545 RepID=UPI0032C0C5D4
MNKNFGNISSNFGNFGGGSGNKGSGFIIVVIIAILTVFFNLKTLSGGDTKEIETKPSEEQVVKKKKPTKSDEIKTSESKIIESTTNNSTETESSTKSLESSEKPTNSNLEKEQILLSTSIVTQENLPDYDGINKGLAINGGFADFDIDEFFGNKSFKSGWVQFSDLDSLNRVQVA